MKNKIGKILVLSVIFIFLGVAFAPTMNAILIPRNIINIIEPTVKTVNGLPDLTVKAVIKSGSKTFTINAIIFNIGTASLPKGTHFTWAVDVEDNDVTYGVTVILKDSLDPGMSIIGCDLLPLSYPISEYKSLKFTIIVDSDKEIDELDESNNFYKGNFPDTRSLADNVYIRIFSMSKIFLLPKLYFFRVIII